MAAGVLVTLCLATLASCTDLLPGSPRGSRRAHGDMVPGPSSPRPHLAEATVLWQRQFGPDKRCGEQHKFSFGSAAVRVPGGRGTLALRPGHER